MSIGDILLCLGAAALFVFSLYLRNSRIRSREEKQRQALRTEQMREQQSTAGNAPAEAKKKGKTMQELEISGFHPDVRFVFEDKEKKAPVHVEFAADFKGQQVAYAAAEDAFETRTFLQVNGCEIQECREYSYMVDEINIGLKGSSKIGFSAGSDWMDGVSPKITSLAVILYTGRLMDPPTPLALFSHPHYEDYEHYQEAKQFALDVTDVVNRIISERVK